MAETRKETCPQCGFPGSRIYVDGKPVGWEHCPDDFEDDGPSLDDLDEGDGIAAAVGLSQ